MSITVEGTLIGGLERDGIYHKAFTLRVPTLEEVEDAIEQAGPDANAARIARYKWALCLTRLGDIPPAEITAELLAGLPAYDFAPLQAAEEALLKKLVSASAAHSTPSA